MYGSRCEVELSPTITQSEETLKDAPEDMKTGFNFKLGGIISMDSRTTGNELRGDQQVRILPMMPTHLNWN
jgi:hypothetical protein